MPLLLLLRNLRLPRKGELAIAGGFFAVLLFASWQRRGEKIKALEAQLAARPRTETHVETQTKTVIVQGPEKVVEKLVEGKVVERVVYKEKIVTTTGTEKAYERTTAPAGLATPSRWRYAGVLVDPTQTSKLVGLRGGVTLGNRLDLGLGFRLAPRKEGQAEISLRF